MRQNLILIPIDTLKNKKQKNVIPKQLKNVRNILNSVDKTLKQLRRKNLLKMSYMNFSLTCMISHIFHNISI